MPELKELQEDITSVISSFLDYLICLKLWWRYHARSFKRTLVLSILCPVIVPLVVSHLQCSDSAMLWTKTKSETFTVRSSLADSSHIVLICFHFVWRWSFVLVAEATTTSLTSTQTSGAPSLIGIHSAVESLRSNPGTGPTCSSFISDPIRFQSMGYTWCKSGHMCSYWM